MVSASVRPPRGYSIGGTRVQRRVHHDSHIALWQVRGFTEVTVDSERIELRSDDVLWLPRGVAHALVVAPDSVLFPLWFDADALDATPWGVLPIDVASLVHTHPADRALFLTLVQSQHTILRPESDLPRRIVELLMWRSRATRQVQIPESGPALTVVTGLLDNPADRRSLEAWARVSHASSRTLERSFKQETGLTFRQWRQRNAMRAAEELLATGVAVGAVANRVGYDSQAAFARAFRQWSGVSPRSYGASVADGRGWHVG